LLLNRLLLKQHEFRALNSGFPFFAFSANGLFWLSRHQCLVDQINHQTNLNDWNQPWNGLSASAAEWLLMAAIGATNTMAPFQGIAISEKLLSRG
jgi:hypothetical protein